jgi:hypothetical protein
MVRVCVCGASLGERGADLCVGVVSLRVRGVRYLCVRGGVQVSLARVHVGVV